MDKKQINFKGKLIFKKYKVLKYLDQGSFGSVYLGKNIQNNKFCAIKIERDYDNILKQEAFIQYNLKGYGIPEVISFGRVGNLNILIQTLLGKSIQKIWIENKKKLNLKDVCMLAIQTLDRIELVHSKHYVHRDIKPSNFLVGNPDTSIIYLIDFGNARKYRSSRTGKHIPSSKKNEVFGTILYTSINSMKGKEQSRKDDLESLGYMYIALLKGELPWSHINNLKIEEMIRKTCQLKESTTLENLCKNVPKEFYDYMKYINKLEFIERPDYQYLRGLFNFTLSKLGLKNDNLFSWIDIRKISKFNMRINNYPRRRSNPKIRLFNKINTSNSSTNHSLKTFKNCLSMGVINNNENTNNSIKIFNKKNDNKKIKSSKQNMKINNISIIKKDIEKLKETNLNNINKNENIKNKDEKRIQSEPQGTKTFTTKYPRKTYIKNIIINNITKNNIIENNIIENNIFYNNSLTNKHFPLPSLRPNTTYKSPLYRLNKYNPISKQNSFINENNNSFFSTKTRQKNINNFETYLFNTQTINSYNFKQISRNNIII